MSTRRVSHTGARGKGHTGERELCSLLTKFFNFKKPIQRNVDQMRFGGADIIMLQPFAIEVKRQEQLQIKTWWKQARSQTTKCNPIPILAYRKNHQPWRFLIPFGAVAKKRFEVKKDSYITLELDAFLQYIEKDFIVLSS